MSHKEQFNFINRIKELHANRFVNKSVLEVGSANINGTVRDFFSNCFYVGLDVAKGPCVDMVCLGHELNVPDETFDVVVSSECFEHDPYWADTFRNMTRLCKKDGLIIVTCATTGRKEHGTTRTTADESLTVKLGWDYYKNLTVEDFNQFDISAIFKYHEFDINTESHDLYFYGFKK